MRDTVHVYLFYSKGATGFNFPTLILGVPLLINDKRSVLVHQYVFLLNSAELPVSLMLNPFPVCHSLPCPLAFH